MQVDIVVLHSAQQINSSHIGNKLMANAKISFVLLRVTDLNDPKTASVAKGEVFIVASTSTLYWRNVNTNVLEPLSASGESGSIALILQHQLTILQNQEDIKNTLTQVINTVEEQGNLTRTHVTEKTVTITNGVDLQATAIQSHLNSQDQTLARIEAK